MTFIGNTPLRSYAWAILIGVSTFIALFFASFFSMTERQGNLLRVSSQQDSLLFDAYHMMAQVEDHTVDPASAGQVLNHLFLSCDSLNVALDIALPEDVRRFFDAYHAYGRELTATPGSGNAEKRYALYRDVQIRHDALMAALLDEENDLFRSRIGIWAGVAVSIILIGSWFTFWLASSRHRDATNVKRLSSILHVTEDPVAVFTPDGRTIFANASFRTRFLDQTDGMISSCDRFSYLDTTSEPDRSAALWDDMMGSLEEGARWTTQIPHTQAAARAHFNLYAIAQRDGKDRLAEIVVIHTDVSDVRRLAVKAKEVEDQYRLIVESSPDALVILQHGDVVYVNGAGLDMFGFKSSDTLDEERFSDLFGSAGKLAFHVGMDGRHVGEQILQNAEFRATTRQGTLIDVEASASVVRWGDELALQTTFRDITERKMLEREQALWAWEQDALSEIDRRLVGVVDLKTILSSITHQVLNLSRAHWSGVLMYDDSERFVRWRAIGGNTIAGTEHDRFEVTPTIRALFSGEDPLVVQELQDRHHMSLAAIPGLTDEGIISSAWFPLKGGDHQEGVLVVGYRNYHSFTEREMRLLSSLTEKTAIALANARLYENLLEREQELEVLSGARIDAQEEERRRIAREIHDGLGQILTAIKLNVEIMEDSPGIEEGDRSRFADIKGLLDSMMKEARQISYDLMPSVLEDFGLAPALQLLAERFGVQSGVNVQFFSKGDSRRLEQRMEVALYRITQEALTNSVRHGEADHVTIQLLLTEDTLRLTIEDNGKGMDESMPKLRRAQGGGIGLASMRERVNSFNGTLEIDSAPGRGTLIIVELPLETRPEQGAS